MLGTRSGIVGEEIERVAHARDQEVGSSPLVHKLLYLPRDISALGGYRLFGIDEGLSGAKARRWQHTVERGDDLQLGVAQLHRRDLGFLATLHVGPAGGTLGGGGLVVLGLYLVAGLLFLVLLQLGVDRRDGEAGHADEFNKRLEVVGVELGLLGLLDVVDAIYLVPEGHQLVEVPQGLFLHRQRRRRDVLYHPYQQLDAPHLCRTICRLDIPHQRLTEVEDVFVLHDRLLGILQQQLQQPIAKFEVEPIQC